LEESKGVESSSRRTRFLWFLVVSVVLFGLLLRVPANRSIDVLVIAETIEPIKHAYLLNNDKVIWNGTVDFKRARKAFLRLPYGEGLHMEAELADGTKLSSRGDYFIGTDSTTYIYVIEKDRIAEYAYQGSFLFDENPETFLGRTAAALNLAVFFMAAAVEGAAELGTAIFGPFGQ
jgi:hypothetical protein